MEIMDAEEGYEFEFQLQSSPIGLGNSHIGIIDTTSIVKEEFMTHGLHLNLWCKRKLKLLLAKHLGDNQVLGISNIPCITIARIKTRWC